MKDIDKLKKCFESIGVDYKNTSNSCWDMVVVGATHFNFVGANGGAVAGKLESIDIIEHKEVRLMRTKDIRLK